MTGPEVMRAFEGWWTREGHFWMPSDGLYPLYIGHPLKGCWYVRERMPGQRVWRAEEDGGFSLIDANQIARPLSATIAEP